MLVHEVEHPLLIDPSQVYSALYAPVKGRHCSHEFIEFLLRPDVAAANARVADTATANGAAQRMLPRDPVLYPLDEIYARGTWPPALPSEAQRYRDRLWTEIKAA